MRKYLAIVMAAVLALALVACGTESEAEVDAVSTPSNYTNKYTNLDQAAVMDAIAAYSGVSVVATTNADGTPNIAILTPGTAGDSHIVFNLAPNTSKENILRDKVAEMIFDQNNPAAETKEERHKGAMLRLELEEDQAVIDELADGNDYINDGSLVCRVVEVLPVG